jgi:hypothetical protein
MRKLLLVGLTSARETVTRLEDPASKGAMERLAARLARRAARDRLRGSDLPAREPDPPLPLAA